MFEITHLKEFLIEPKRIVITTHPKPDGDAMGSSLGLYTYLVQKGHQVQVITPTDYPSFLQWMPNNAEVIIFTEKQEESKQYVADDYTLRHVKAIRANSDQYAKMINRLTYRSTGISSTYWA
jgi:nanoRNase/pAp phosphatase (c-di-AMP/oligoRNAs hydrolase)